MRGILVASGRRAKIVRGRELAGAHLMFAELHGQDVQAS